MIAIYFIFWFITPVLSIITSALGMIYDARHYRAFLLCFCMSMGLIAYNLLPIEAYDLSRYYDIMERFSELSLMDNLSKILSGLDPLSYLTMYLVSFFDNARLLQLIGVAAGYWLFTKILLDILKLKRYSWYMNLIFFGIFLCTFEFIQLYSGFRNFIAIGLFLTLIYTELLREKRLPTLWYLVPVLFHSSMILPFIIIALLKWNRRIILKILVVSLPLATFGLAAIKGVVQQYSNIHVLGLIADKLQWYSPDYTFVFKDDYYLFKLISLIAVAIIFTIVVRKHKARTTREKQLVSLIKIMIFATLCMIINYTFFARYATFTYFAIFFYLVYNLSIFRVRGKLIIVLVLAAVGVVMLQAQYVYISLLSNHTEWLEFLTSNVVSIW